MKAADVFPSGRLLANTGAVVIVDINMARVLRALFSVRLTVLVRLTARKVVVSPPATATAVGPRVFA